jgi:choline kinase
LGVALVLRDLEAAVAGIVLPGYKGAAMREVTDAVVLMAGSGSRLRASGEITPKPLVPILGQPLVCYLLEALLEAGVNNLHVVVGANAESLVAALQSLMPASIRLHPIRNPDWKQQNGISVLCAQGKVRAPFFLTMGDHLFDPEILPSLLKTSSPDELNLAVDRKISAIFDLDDAMKVQTRADRVIAIGKDLADYDAIDTGLFLCPNELFEYLRAARKNGDCSLADGVRLMAEAGKVRATDIGEGWWQDVDTFAMRKRAEELLAQSAASLVGHADGSGTDIPATEAESPTSGYNAATPAGVGASDSCPRQLSS